MPFILRGLRLNKAEIVSVVDKGASGDETHRPRIVIMKRAGIPPKPLTKAGSYSMTLEEVLATLPEEAKAVVMAALEQATKAATPPAEKKPDEQGDLMKSLPEELRKKFDAQAKEAEELRKANAETTKQLEEIKKRDRAREFTAIAKSLESLPGISTEDLAVVLEKADRTMGDDYKKLFDAIQSAAKAVDESPLMKSMSSVRAPSGSALEVATSLAKKLMGEDPSLNESRARARVFETNAELYARYQQERRGVA